MITAHPSLLRDLIERCETLSRRLATHPSADTLRRLEDATYTLCVITGTRQLDTALFVARQQMAAALQCHQPLRR
ncbi:DUF5133 domain-containing protein [Streptomyces osmaniensis]|uniref:DUF5133 domain-containing protein n=1 Tax=Streptomyces osmaniensis TaxID=593134 RepID=A0ABP6VYN6_9ACTN|nr:DUF5133 domain-containing protein [Streptomyces sp. JCM17656]